MPPDQNISPRPLSLRILLAGGLALIVVFALLFGGLSFSSWFSARGARGLTQEEKLGILSTLSGTVQRSDAEREAALASIETKSTVSEEQKLRVLESLK